MLNSNPQCKTLSNFIKNPQCKTLSSFIQTHSANFKQLYINNQRELVLCNFLNIKGSCGQSYIVIPSCSHKYAFHISGMNKNYTVATCYLAEAVVSTTKLMHSNIAIYIYTQMTNYAYDYMMRWVCSVN